MKKSLRGILAVFVLLILMFAVSMPVFAAEAQADAVPAGTAAAEAEKDNSLGNKAWAAAAVVGVVAFAGALGMAWTIAKSVDGIARQPEAEGKIRTTLMLGLVFVETAIIYALVIAILIIFVL